MHLKLRISSWWIPWWQLVLGRILWWWECLLFCRTKMPTLLNNLRLKSSTACNRWLFISRWHRISRQHICRHQFSSRCLVREELQMPQVLRALANFQERLVRFQWCLNKILWWVWWEEICQTYLVKIWELEASVKTNKTSCHSNHSCQWCTQELIQAPTSNRRTSRVKRMKSDSQKIWATKNWIWLNVRLFLNCQSQIAK